MLNDYKSLSTSGTNNVTIPPSELTQPQPHSGLNQVTYVIAHCTRASWLWPSIHNSVNVVSYQPCLSLGFLVCKSGMIITRAFVESKRDKAGKWQIRNTQKMLSMVHPNSDSSGSYIPASSMEALTVGGRGERVTPVNRSRFPRPYEEHYQTLLNLSSCSFLCYC